MSDLIKIIEDLSANIQSPERDPEPSFDYLKKCSSYLFDLGWMPHDKDAFAAICRWMAVNYERKKQRGLMLIGGAGVGKTMLMRLFYPDSIATAADAVAAYKRNDGQLNNGFWYDLYRVYDSDMWTVRNMVIDDMGEEEQAKHYGQTEEVLTRMICQRYRDWTDNPELRLHITSNLNGAEMDARYGRRVTDRLAEMCEIVKFKTKSVRQKRKG